MGAQQQSYPPPPPPLQPQMQAQGPQAQPLGLPKPPQALPKPPQQWTQFSDGKDTWFKSSAGETAWQLPQGAVVRPAGVGRAL